MKKKYLVTLNTITIVVLLIFLFSASSYSQQKFTEKGLIKVAEQAFLLTLKNQNAEYGYVIIADTKTGNIVSAMSKRKSKGLYINDSSFLDKEIVPEGLMLPISLSVLLDNNNVTIQDSVDLEGGETKFDSLDVWDNEYHELRYTNYKDIVAISSKVGIAKGIYKYYNNKPYSFLNQLNEIVGYSKADTLNQLIPFDAIGLGIKFKPLKLLSFYNAVANGGNYLELNLNHTAIVPRKMFKKDSTFTNIQQCLKSVCERRGTGFLMTLGIVKGNVAGKTATIMNLLPKQKGNNVSYSSAFIGYFPTSHPKYTCFVFIKNKPDSPLHFGGEVAAPIVKEIAEYYLSK